MIRGSLACGLALALLAGTASALSVGPGGFVYTGTAQTTVINTTTFLSGVSLYRATLNSNWDNTTRVVNFDCVTETAREQSAFVVSTNSVVKIEVWDPRAQAGQGNLAVAGTFQIYTYGHPTNFEHQPFDVALVDTHNPANNKSFSTAAGNLLMLGCAGTNGYNGTGTTEKVAAALRTAKNWSGQTTGSSNIGIALMAPTLSYRYDTNSSNYADNTALEFTVGNTLAGTSDSEVGPDGAVYTTQANGSGGAGKIQRIASATATPTTYATVGGGGTPMGKVTANSANLGIAMGGTAGSPILYAAAQDNVGGTYTQAIFALRDGNADGSALTSDAADCIVEIWKSGSLGITQTNVYDVEYYKDDNGVQWLLFSGGTADANNMFSLYAMQLADNGLAAVGAKLVGAGLAGRSFEFDANPVSPAPEPATALLLGTAALGATGYLRRRRV